MKRPCIRGLKEFKKGCPEKAWDGNSGCPAWKEYTIPGQGGNAPFILKDCVDCTSEYWQIEALKLLEGNQVAIETFRNNMSTEGSPKPDPALMKIATLMENKPQLKR